MTSDLSTAQKVGQLFFIGIDGTELGPKTVELLDEISPGGICLFSRNIREREQTRYLTDAIRNHSQILPFLSIDQEGGLVDRFRRILPAMPPAEKLTEIQQCQRAGEIIGEALRLVGLNMDFAPVVDVVDETRDSTSNGLHSRAFGRSPDDVVSLAGAFLEALEAQGILGCLKHFPGLGASRVDSHEDLPRVEINGEEFESKDLFPYRVLLSVERVRPLMVAHATFPAIGLQEKDQNGKLIPTSLSYNFVTTLLRQKLNFDGLVITDDLQMGAIIKNYGIGDACIMALNAGVDMLAICSDSDVIRKGYSAVTLALENGVISSDRVDESIRRILAAKGKLQEPRDFDIDNFDRVSSEITSLHLKLSRA